MLDLRSRRFGTIYDIRYTMDDIVTSVQDTLLNDLQWSEATFLFLTYRVSNLRYTMLDVQNLSLTTKFTKKAQSLTKNIVIEELKCNNLKM